MSERDPLKTALIRAVRDAGAEALKIRSRGLAVESKKDASPVTEADRKAEAILTAAVEACMPGVTIVAEERVADEGAPDPTASFVLIDPLDGTKEFVAGRDEFTVNVAWVQEGRPVLGVVGAPALNRIYVGDPDAGAVRIDGDAPPKPIRVRAPGPGPLEALASRSHADAQTERFLAAIDAGRKSAGSSLKFCVVAEGDADLYPRFGPTMAWDTAAAQAVLEAAGGVVAHLDGSPFRYPSNPADGWRNPSFIAFGALPDDARAFVLDNARNALS